MRTLSSFFVCFLAFASISAIAIGQGTSELSSESGPQSVRILVFYDRGCNDCETLKNQILPMLMDKYGFPIETRYIELKDTESYGVLLNLERKYQDAGNELPVVFVGEYVLGGIKEIEENLDQVVENYVYTGGCDWPAIEETEQINLEANGKIYLAFFSRPGCKHCDRVQHMLANLERRSPDLTIRTFDSLERENVRLQEAICEIAGIPEEKRLISPTVVIDRDYLIKEEITDSSLEELVTKYLHNGSSCVWEEAEKITKQAEKGIIDRFNSLGIFAVIGAGLVDGINPCAFTTLIFFIAYLAFIGRKGREVLYTGAAFTGAVFMTYLLIGLGAFKFLHSLTAFPFLRHILYLLAAGAALVFGALSIHDYYKIKRDNVKEMKLQLPKIVKDRIHKIIREQSRIRNFLIAAFVAGFLISILELACTGQMYLPTIAFVAGAPHLRNRAIFLLVIYNLMFVLPLVAVFFLSFYGTTSQKLSRVMMKHLGRTKILTGALFFCLGILLILTWVRSF